jgi:hypothetical protein
VAQQAALGFFISAKIPNSKHQIPNKYKIQRAKGPKGTYKPPSFGFCISVFGIVWNLVLGIWDFRRPEFAC